MADLIITVPVIVKVRALEDVNPIDEAKDMAGSIECTLRTYLEGELADHQKTQRIVSVTTGDSYGSRVDIPPGTRIIEFESNEPTIRSAGICMLSPYGMQVLGVKVTVNDVEGWALPGGKLEGSETAKQAAIREFYEEAGITVSPSSLRSIHVGPSINPNWLHQIFYSNIRTGFIVEGKPHPLAFIDPIQLFNGPYAEYYKELEHKTRFISQIRNGRTIL